MNPQRRVILVVLAFALALVSLDNTIVNVALPRLQEDLGASTSALQWIIDAYSVVFAGTLLLAGSLGDRFGRRRMLIIGLTIFIVASTLAAISPDAAALTACRGLMGFGAAFIMPSTLSILVSTFTNSRERGQAIGIWAAVAGAGVAVGPIVGGLLLEHFSWHSIFWVNPPIAACVL
ncbi:MAG: MFS transporter, partial [Actinobacteria bacterium]|nr:MFS transporter [Actinomycetota bacterium]